MAKTTKTAPQRAGTNSRLAQAMADLRRVQEIDAAGFAILCSVIERVRAGVEKSST